MELPIIEFYRQFLSDLDCTVDKHGQIFQVAGQEKAPLKVDIKRRNKRVTLPVYLPLKRLMDEEDTGDKVYFHPACESIFRGQSEILTLIVKLVNIKLDISVFTIASSIMALAHNTDAHSSVDQDTMEEILSHMPTVSKATLQAFLTAKRNKLTSGRGKYPLVTLKLARTDKRSTVHTRTATFNSPFLEDENLYGIKFSNTAKLAVRKAMELTLGELPVVKNSDANTAPYFTALVSCFHEVMTNLKAVMVYLEGHMVRDVNYAGDWRRDLGKLGKWYKDKFFIQLEGNMGSGKDVTPGEEPVKEEAPKVGYNAPHQEPARPTHQTPAPAAPEPEEEDDDVTPTFKSPLNPAQAKRDIYAPPAPPPGHYPPPGHGYPPQNYYPPQGDYGHPPPQQGGGRQLKRHWSEVKGQWVEEYVDSEPQHNGPVNNGHPPPHYHTHQHQHHHAPPPPQGGYGYSQGGHGGYGHAPQQNVHYDAYGRPIYR